MTNIEVQNEVHNNANTTLWWRDRDNNRHAIPINNIRTGNNYAYDIYYPSRLRFYYSDYNILWWVE